MIDPQIIAFAVTAALLTITPGQDTMLVVRNVLRGGRRDGILTTFGICAGLFMHAMLSALGMSVVLTHSATAFQLLKFAGIGYLLWLGARSLYSALHDPQPAETQQPLATRAVSGPRSVLEGLLSNVLNPKTALFYLAFLPQFIGPHEPVLQKSLVLAGIHYLEGIVWLVFVALVVDRTRRLFVTSSVRRWLDGVCGALFIGFGVRLALTRE